MTTFSINDKALEEIRQIIGESGCIDPVVTLSETVRIPAKPVSRSDSCRHSVQRMPGGAVLRRATHCR